MALLRLGLAILSAAVGSAGGLVAAQFATTTEVVEVYATVTEPEGRSRPAG